jgi:hypothetical protein
MNVGQHAGEAASMVIKEGVVNKVGDNIHAIRLWPQITLIVGSVAAYFLVRGATEGAVVRAQHNAAKVLGFERFFGLDIEPALQEVLAKPPMVTTVMNWIYIWGHWPVIVVTLLWLGLRHPDVFRRTRNAMIASGALGLLVFVNFPVAPPRLIDMGMVDTVTVGSEAYRVLQPTMFTNQYAALPSLHVGWDLLIGLAIFVAARRAWVRAIGVAMPIAMTVAVVLTANHYIIDAIAGAALTATCWYIAGRVVARRNVTVPRQLRSVE